MKVLCHCCQAAINDDIFNYLLPSSSSTNSNNVNTNAFTANSNRFGLDANQNPFNYPINGGANTFTPNNFDNQFQNSAGNFNLGNSFANNQFNPIGTGFNQFENGNGFGSSQTFRDSIPYAVVDRGQVLKIFIWAFIIFLKWDQMAR